MRATRPGEPGSGVVVEPGGPPERPRASLREAPSPVTRVVLAGASGAPVASLLAVVVGRSGVLEALAIGAGSALAGVAVAWLVARRVARSAPAASHEAVMDVESEGPGARRLAEQLRQAQKMEAVGLLAGGVAHDFNNLLCVILGHGELLAARLVGSEHAASLTAMLTAAERASVLTKQLLAFGRRQALRPRVVDLNEVVSELVGSRILHNLGIGIELRVRTDAAPCRVRVDPIQIEQVLLNLVLNARDAMRDGGLITIATEARIVAATEVDGATSVRLSVEDTGEGMDAETVGRIFEPFFTTKGPDRGTGLGLSTVYGIVSQLGGEVRVWSEPGRGTRFDLYFREAGPVEDPVAVVHAPSRPRAARGTILLVEGEPAVRELMCRTLADDGHLVLPAGTGAEALQRSRGHGGRIDLLVTDLVLPTMTGVDLARIVRAERPDVAVLFVSGYAAGARSDQGTLDEGSVLLEKPFTMDSLRTKVAEAMSEPVARR